LTEKNTKSGSISEFRSNWAGRKESFYSHWTCDEPHNQIQLAFRSHWEVFSELMNSHKPGHSLEVGCGRGSLSSYFADNGWETTLLDTSPEVLDIAKNIFSANGHHARFTVGDANHLPFDKKEFDVVSSIGLLEHFEDSSMTIREQWRVLKPGGWLFAYIVPERPDNLQRYFNWINVILRLTVGKCQENNKEGVKQAIYRSDAGSEIYLPIFQSLSPEHIFVSGMYSMPMISHSPEFPFSLLPVPMERILVIIFRVVLAIRKLITGRHGWLCNEKMGQAFLIAVKKSNL